MDELDEGEVTIVEADVAKNPIIFYLNYIMDTCPLKFHSRGVHPFENSSTFPFTKIFVTTQ